MKIKHLHLYTHNPEAELDFYTRTLGFELVSKDSDSFSIRVGWSILTFSRSEQRHVYHYCFMIPCNQLESALAWMEKRVNIVTDAHERKTHHFASWNADAFYFFDGSGNIAEFIVRYDLQNESQTDFDISRVLCVNEIGMPGQNIEKLNEQLNREMHTHLWKGDLTRFGVHGDQEGLFLLPNYNIKDLWFPIRVPVQPEPFDAIVEADGKEYEVEYQNEKLTIAKVPSL